MQKFSGFWGGAICALCLSATVYPLAYRPQENAKPPGLEPYIPNRIEWLRVELADLDETLKGQEVRVGFPKNNDGYTLTISLLYNNDITARKLNDVMEQSTSNDV